NITQKSGGSRGGGGHPPRSGGGNRQPKDGENPQPSPWLLDDMAQSDRHASFIEYLRWMRSLTGKTTEDANTKLQLLQWAEEGGDYFDRLKTLTDRTRKIAGTRGEVFQAKCAWRMRVGGHRGPESILLPAFDALGIPYVPSSTLRGVARTQAIRSTMQSEGLSWSQAEEQVSRRYFGYLDSKKSAERSGKIIFLDAYPLPQSSGKSGGLAVDMANNIWRWEGDNPPAYSPNPNPFFSLQEPTLLIGLRPGPGCDAEILKQVKKWLVEGLQLGVGSQVNTGYGSLLVAGEKSPQESFFAVEFSLEGQLIHGQQRFTQWNWNDRRNEWQMRGKPEAEVRPVAFKSMLRYWFRAFALGVLPSREVKILEAKLFGAIDPQKRGWVIFQIHNGKLVHPEARPTGQGKNDNCGKQSGELKLFLSSEVPSEQQKQQAIESLMQSLVWLMFRLGGIGQGARRPRYSRKTRQRAPWWRGSTLFPETESDFWELPDAVTEFQTLFRSRLQNFYDALAQLTDRNFTPRQPGTVTIPQGKSWVEAVDANCAIVVCAGDEDYGKPYALSKLHSNEFKTKNRQGQLDYDGNLCGQVQGGVKPSPVWIADLGDYQVATIFGATRNPRQAYLQTLQRGTSQAQFSQIWPL
ncbi:MAG: RAMP superfamily CRISPR-associated protein, partial [Prochlorothrix sp.]